MRRASLPFIGRCDDCGAHPEQVITWSGAGNLCVVCYTTTEAERTPAGRAMLAAGFRASHAGGGTVGFTRPGPAGSYTLITCANDASAPRALAEPVTVGTYVPVNDAEGNDNGEEPVAMFNFKTLRAALAALAAGETY